MRKRREPDRSALLQPGEMVSVRAYAGSRADEEPRAIVVGGTEIPVEEIYWRAVVETLRGRKRAFVVRAAGVRVRLAHDEATDAWEIERVLGPAGDVSA